MSNSAFSFSVRGYTLALTFLWFSISHAIFSVMLRNMLWKRSIIFSVNTSCSTWKICATLFRISSEIAGIYCHGCSWKYSGAIIGVRNMIYNTIIRPESSKHSWLLTQKFFREILFLISFITRARRVLHRAFFRRVKGVSESRSRYERGCLIEVQYLRHAESLLIDA